MVDTLRLFGPIAEKGKRVPDKTAVEDVQGKSQSRQQALVATATQSASRPDPTQYVGTPAIGTSKAAAAAGVPSIGPTNTAMDRRRRRFVWSCVAAFLAAWFTAFFRFFLPRVLFEPATVFKIGYAGPSCTGKTVAVTSQTLTPTGLGEDYHGFEGAPPTGSRVTIDFDLAMVPAASSLSQRWLSGGGEQI